MTDTAPETPPKLATPEDLAAFTEGLNALLEQAGRMGKPVTEGDVTICRVEALLALILPEDQSDPRRLAYEFSWRRRLAERAQNNIDTITKPKLVIPGQ